MHIENVATSLIKNNFVKVNGKKYIGDLKYILYGNFFHFLVNAALRNMVINHSNCLHKRIN